MKFGSLFSGIGGFDLGFAQAGLLCSWQVEIDGDCGRVLEKHWPGVAKHKDVRDVGQLEPVDVICGGFPCQDLSVAGQRKGLAGERSGLWFEFLRIVGLNKPRWVVIENVPGLLSSDEHRDFAAILRGLVECGYCLAWRVCDAQFYGVAQRRRRVFIVGSLGDGSCAEILFESESVSWNPPTRREAGAGVTPCIDGSPYADREAEHGRLVIPLQEVNGRQSKNQRNGGPPNLIAEAVDVRNLRMQPDGISGTVQHKKSGGYSLNYQNPICFSSKDHGADAGEIAPTLRSQNFDKSHINGGGQRRTPKFPPMP